MKLFLINSIYLSLLYPIKGNEGQNSIDAQMGKQYQFELFENFNGCADVYRKEAEIVNQLSDIKKKLTKVQEKLTKLGKCSRLMKDLKIHLESAKNYQSKQILNFESVHYDFPKVIDVIGSIKAMFILHYSYNINMSLAVQDGTLAYKDHFGILRKHQV